MPKVYNKRRPHEIPEDAIYVGRPSNGATPIRVLKTKHGNKPFVSSKPTPNSKIFTRKIG